MNTWKTKLFGDNRLNFYGWIVTGLLIFGASLWYVIRAINLGAGRSPSGLLLINTTPQKQWHRTERNDTAASIRRWVGVGRWV